MITPENMLDALNARIPCPVCEGTVRLTLASNYPGDLVTWLCNQNRSHEWDEGGKPRWEVVEAFRIQVTT